MRGVVDAQPEAMGWIEAALGGNIEAAVPDVVFYEIANSLTNYVRAGMLDPQESESRLQDVLSLPLEIHPARTLAAQAHAFAVARGISAYDGAYLALAIGYDAVLVTADRRLAAQAERSALV